MAEGEDDGDTTLLRLLKTTWESALFAVRAAVLVFTFTFLTWLYCRLTTKQCKCTTRLEGKTALVTGGSVGIGYETAKALACRGARVIFTCRNMQVGKQALASMIEASGGGDIVLKQLDLSSLASVRSLANDILANEPRLDLLVNNAGRTAPFQRTLSVDGLETTIQSNHLGPALLTGLLLDLLKRSAPSRIVVVSSMVHAWVHLDPDDPFLEHHYTHSRAYGLSKLYNLYFARELAGKLRGELVTVNALHPGMVKSRFFREQATTYFSKFLRYVVIPLFGKSPSEGAQTSIHLCLSPELTHTTGRYFMECHETMPAEHAMDPVLQRQAWDITEKALNVRLCS
ncbi:retinol dehydrogenase 14 [Rhipicephalus sanguineus]|uniref:retinol dehydrogenase 14 n=1 Tax=Rhipicephalus sanguineus TaxID=34632 RepID=UPI0018940EE8|nr:retinol dehydrogenase 14 [Rhipicephalus sanguineus]